MEITYQEFKPTALLAPYVECYWLHTFKGIQGEYSPVQRCLPLGMLEVLMHPDEIISEILLDGEWQYLPESFFHGIYNNPVYWRTKANSRLFGIRFKPEMFRELFNVPAASVFCNFIDLEEFLGAEVRCLPESIKGLHDVNDIIAQANLFLSQRLKRSGTERNYVAEAAALMRKSLGTISIEEVSHTLGISTRQLQRCFKESTGTGPKSYLRIIRFRNALSSLRDADKKDALCDLTYSLGYADQAHFIREFKEFAGEAPKSIIKNSDCYHKKPFELTDKEYECIY